MVGLEEKYRPDSLDDVIGQDEIINNIKTKLEEGDVQDMLFAGPPGVGKTSTAIALVKDMYGDNWSANFKELNASDDRGIDAVREEIKEYAKANFDDKKRVIFLDEADSLTDQAQSALRRTMEQNSDNCLYILSCNYKGKLIPAIQSRCVVYNYGNVDEEEIKEYLMEISNKEDLDITEDAIRVVASYAGGDVRSALIALGQMAIGPGTTDKDEVYKLLPISDEDDIRRLIQFCVDGEFNEALEYADELMYDKGLTARNIMSQLHEVVWDMDIDDEVKVRVINRVGEADFRINEGADERMQIAAALASITRMSESNDPVRTPTTPDDDDKTNDQTQTEDGIPEIFTS